MLLTQPRAKVFCLTLPLILFLSLTCFGQANVNESLETATVYVDGVNGSDSNPGTSAEPLKTIGAGVSKAVNNNHNGIGTKVIIRPATYRESIAVGHSGKSTSLPMTFE